MKKLILLVLSLILFTITLFWSACSKTKDEGWTDEEKQSYEEVINLQDEVGNNLDDWFQTMDSLDAINEAYQLFVNSELTNSATINSQGIAVQYGNGMRGGLFLKGKKFDYKKSTTEIPTDESSDGNLKSIVNKRKMLQMDAAYSEFSYYTDQVHNKHESNLSKVGISITEYLKDDEVTLDRLTQLSGYGMIDMSSHGIAWPKETNITDVYYLSGETVSENSSKKYWDDLKTGNIPVMKVWYLNRVGKYFVSPDFITKYNDFSKDTVYFYGGFCYSFLGGWPDIIDDFGDGAYLGFNWSVQGFHCANWDINSIALMSDTAKQEPFTLEEWMNDSGVEKSYWDAEDSKTVKIHYTGDGNLTLWGDISINLIAMSDDGTPVSEPGEAGEPYPFRCEVISNITELEYLWDIGDGSGPVSASNEVNITWSEDGQYVLKVDVKDKSNGTIIGTATADVQIGDQNVKEFVSSCNQMIFRFGPRSALVWENERSGDATKDYGDFEWYNNLVWSGLSFEGTLTADDNSYTNNVTGNISGDGQKVSFVAEQNSYDSNSDTHSYYKFTVENYPLDYFTPPTSGSGWASYSVEESQYIQNYVTAFEGREWDNSGYSMHISGVNWEAITVLRIGFYQD